MSQPGTEQEIQDQAVKVWEAENALMAAKLRLRALKGEALMQFGDSVSVLQLGETLKDLENEFGARNLRMM